MTDSNGAPPAALPPTIPSWRQRKQPYRHRTDTCSRLLFEAYLAPGSRVEIRCPACGLMHVITTPLLAVNGTAVLAMDAG